MHILPSKPIGMLAALLVAASIVSVSSLTLLSTKNNVSNQRFSPNDCTKHQLPSLLYIGEGHAASTTLAELVNEHPGLQYGSRKEHHYFACEPMMADCDYNLEEYKSGFEVYCSTNHTFDASTNYMTIAEPSYPAEYVLHHNPGIDAVREVYNTLPAAKIMVVIRDPVDYLFSIGISNISDMVASWDACVVDILDVWMNVFPKSNFLVLRAEDNFNDMPSATKRTWEFMGLEPLTFSEDEWSAKVKYHEEAGRRRNAQKPSMELRQEFHSNARVKDCKHRLEFLTGIQFPWLASQ